MGLNPISVDKFSNIPELNSESTTFDVYLFVNKSPGNLENHKILEIKLARIFFQFRLSSIVKNITLKTFKLIHEENRLVNRIRFSNKAFQAMEF